MNGSISNLVKDKRNCFRCFEELSGEDVHCPMSLFAPSYGRRCVYSVVAQRDLTKRFDHDPNTTLTGMLMDFLEYKKGDVVAK